MINIEKIVLNEPIYYTPNWSGITKISVIEIVNKTLYWFRCRRTRRERSLNRSI